MEVTIKITNNSGNTRELTRHLSINTDSDVIKEVERELGLLNDVVNKAVFEQSLIEAQTLYTRCSSF